MKSIKVVSGSDLQGKRVLLRLDLNVPVEQGRVTDDFRIMKSLPTLSYLSEQGAKTLIISHFGSDGSQSLLPVYDALKNTYPNMLFLRELFHPQTHASITQMREGGVALFENIRRYSEEEKNDAAFAAQLAALGDLYVNDAFSASHRMHASIVGVPKHLPAFAGFQCVEEVAQLSRAFSAEHPFLFVLGGAKFDTKLPLLKKFLETADTVFVGGAIANDLLEAKGFEVGRSLTTEDALGQKEIAVHKKVELPGDVVVEHDGEHTTKNTDTLSVDDRIVDAGAQTLGRLRELAASARFILWNGPLGYYEGGFSEGTETLARIIAETNAVSIVGGGDTIAAISKLHLEDKFTFVSTGGGAMLDFLATETLPGIEALKSNQ